MIVGLVILAAAAAHEPGVAMAYETRSLAESWAAANHQRMDANGDGYVTRGEIAAFVVHAMNGLPIPGADATHPLPAVSEAIFEAADTDHDGRLSLAEQIAAADRDFTAMDANHDGVVSPDERTAYVARQLGSGHLPFDAAARRGR